MSVKSQLERVRATLPEYVTLVAVSKTHPVEAIAEAYEAGQRIFGESRPQELRAKYEALPRDIEWHMIAYDVTVTPEFDGLDGVEGIFLVTNDDLHANYAIPSAFSAYTKYL